MPIHVHCCYLTDYTRNESQLLQHVAKFEKQLEYLQRLINLINVQNLTQVRLEICDHSWLFLYFFFLCDEMVEIGLHSMIQATIILFA